MASKITKIKFIYYYLPLINVIVVDIVDVFVIIGVFTVIWRAVVSR